MDEMASMEETLCDVAGHLNAQHARLVDVTVWLLANERFWSGPGVWRAEQYLAWKVGVAPSRAKQIVEIAQRAGDLPESVGAFRRGELAVDQMAAIAKRAPWWTDAEICALGKCMTVRQLRNVLSAYPFPDIPKPGEGPDAGMSSLGRADGEPEPDEQAETTAGDDTPSEVGDDAVLGCSDPADRCAFHFDDDGQFHLHLETDKLTGVIIEAALTEARDRRFHDGQSDVSWTDAVREVCERSLDAVADPDRRRRFRVNFHIDANGGAVDATGWRLPDAIRRHVTCDGLLSPVFIEGGLPVSVGRSQHIVPDRTRRLVELRDQDCRVQGVPITGGLTFITSSTGPITV